MAEMEKDFQRVQSEKFDAMKENCPWMVKSRMDRVADTDLCEASYNVCTMETCAVWYFLEK